MVLPPVLLATLTSDDPTNSMVSQDVRVDLRSLTRRTAHPQCGKKYSAMKKETFWSVFN